MPANKMARRWMLCLLGAAAIFCGCLDSLGSIGTAWAQESAAPSETAPPAEALPPPEAEAPTEPTYDFKLKDTAVRDVLRNLATIAGMNVLVDDSVTPEIKISIILQNVTAKQAFEAIVQAKGLIREEVLGVISIKMRKVKVDEKEVKEYRFFKLTNINLDDSVRSRVEGYLDKEDKVDYFIPERAFYVEAPKDTLDKIGEFLKNIDVAPPVSKEAPVTPEKAKLVSKIFQVNVVPVKDAEAKLKEYLSEQGTLVVDENTGKIFVEDVAENISTMENVLAELDAAEKQVLLEAKLIEVTLTDSDKYGLSWILQEFENGAFTGDYKIAQTLLGSSQDPLASADVFQILMGRSTDNLTVTIDTLIGSRRANTLASPVVACLNKTEATITITRQIPFVQSTTTTSAAAGTGGSTGQTSTQQISFEETGVTMKVTPDIRPNGLIKLDIEPEFSVQVGETAGTPIIDTRSLKTVVIVQDGQTLILGGLIQDEHSNTRKRIPLLGYLPVLGDFLFSSSDEKVTRQELILFVRPTIYDPQITERYIQERRRIVDTDKQKYIEGKIKETARPLQVPGRPAGETIRDLPKPQTEVSAEEEEYYLYPPAGEE